MKYDTHDLNIGKEFIVIGPMVYLNNVDKRFAGTEIASEFGSLITPKYYWRDLESRFSRITSEDVQCGERFVVVGALHLIPIGLIEASTNTTLKYYVVNFAGHSETVIEESNFEEYTKPLDHNRINGDCVSSSLLEFDGWCCQ